MIEFYKDRRSTQLEIMDDLDFQGVEMGKLLKDLKVVNQWLGGYKISLKALSELLKNSPKHKKIKILDIGCGDGHMLKLCGDFLQKNGYEYEGIGIDFNPNILKIARAQSKNYPNISFSQLDVLKQGHLIPKCDFAFCTLFLHHFSDEKIELLLQLVLAKTEVAIIINDLQRSKLAFNLFRIFSLVALKTETARYDGLVSVARSFSKNEIESITNKLPNQTTEITWKWAFRYLCVLKK